MAHQRSTRKQTMNQRDDYTDELVSAYFDGELAGDELARVEQLLTRGERESQWLEQIKSLRQDLRLMPTPQPERDFSRRTLEAVRRAQPEMPPPHIVPRVATNAPSLRRLSGWVSAAVAVAAVLLLAAYWMNRPVDPPGGFTVARQDRATDEDDAASGRVADDAQADATAADLAGAGDVPTPSGRPGDVPKPENAAKGPLTRRLPVESVMQDPKGGDRPVPQIAADPPVLADPQPVDSQMPVPDRPLPDVGTVTGGTDKATGRALPRKTLPRKPEDSGQLLMVIDVTLTPAGRQHGRFEQLLTDHQIPFDATLVVQEELENTLMRSRFLKPAQEVPLVPNEDVQLVYVVTRGGRVDEMWRRWG